MLDWQKSTAPDRVELERNAERVGITRSDVADYFKRLDSEWDGHDERITSHCGDKAQFMCDGANWLAEQIEAIRNIPKSLRPHYKMPRLETPFEHGDYSIVTIID